MKPTKTTIKMTNMNFDELAQEAFETAKAHGWHDEEKPDETYLMLIMTEIAEAVQADRKGKHADAGLFNADVETLDMADDYDREVWKRDFEIYIKNTVEDELADTVIRILDLAGLIGCDLSNVKTLLDRGMNKVKETFPEFMYRISQSLTDKMETLRSRLNYGIACIIGYCKQKGIDIEFFIEQKMKYNKLRSFRHGNKNY